MLIDCNRCAMQHSAHCKECVVTALLDPAPEQGAVVIDADEERALREMARAGLIPEIRMKRRRDTG
jgi:hypothetical protein